METSWATDWYHASMSGISVFDCCWSAGVERIGPICYLAWCSKRQLSQALSVLCIILDFYWLWCIILHHIIYSIILFRIIGGVRAFCTNRGWASVRIQALNTGHILRVCIYGASDINTEQGYSKICRQCCPRKQELPVVNTRNVIVNIWSQSKNCCTL